MARRAVVLIPARLGSTRMPRKVLADDTGHPLVWHVREAAMRAQSATRVVIATDSGEVRSAVEERGGEVVMTSPDHPNGTSRLDEAAQLLGLGDDEVVVNAQGDEPELDPALIDAAVEALRPIEGRRVVTSTVASPLRSAEELENPNVVKAIVRGDGTARSFTRAPIEAGGGESGPYRHVGLYVYTRAFLREYVRLPETAGERAERLEQLRILEHGLDIAVAVRESSHTGIDTPEQYEAFVRRWRGRA